MFTGIIHKTGQLVYRTRTRMGVQTKGLFPSLGDSVAINGVCLTVSNRSGNQTRGVIYFDLSEETLQKTTLSKLALKSLLNLEEALKMSDALGGHIVQGHVDGTGIVQKVTQQKDMKTIRFKAPKSIMEHIVPKGSITVDGVSLTAVEVDKSGFSVALIPYTLATTNLNLLKKGTEVNLEADIIGKYVSRYTRKK